MKRIYHGIYFKTNKPEQCGRCLRQTTFKQNILSYLSERTNDPRCPRCYFDYINIVLDNTVNAFTIMAKTRDNTLITYSALKKNYGKCNNCERVQPLYMTDRQTELCPSCLTKPIELLITSQIVVALAESIII